MVVGSQSWPPGAAQRAGDRAGYPGPAGRRVGQGPAGAPAPGPSGCNCLGDSAECPAEPANPQTGERTLTSRV